MFLVLTSENFRRWKGQKRDHFLKGSHNFWLRILPHAFLKKWERQGLWQPVVLFWWQETSSWKMILLLLQCSQSAVAVTSTCPFLHSCRPFGTQSFCRLPLCFKAGPTGRRGHTHFCCCCLCDRSTAAWRPQHWTAVSLWFLLPPRLFFVWPVEEPQAFG